MRPVLLLILNFNFSSGAVTKLYVMVPENVRNRIKLVMEIRIFFFLEDFQTNHMKIRIILETLFIIQASESLEKSQ